MTKDQMQNGLLRAVASPLVALAAWVAFLAVWWLTRSETDARVAGFFTVPVLVGATVARAFDCRSRPEI